MSDKVFDIKIYELQLKSIKGAKKTRIEIFWVDEPDIVFRCDMFSELSQDGSHLVIEKINLVEQLSLLKNKNDKDSKYNPSSFAKDGLVLAICESNFPHKISFFVIEPCSHIQWEFSYSDEKLSVIETRQQRLNFVSNLYHTLNEGILRSIDDPEECITIKPGAQMQAGEDQSKQVYCCIGDIQKMLTNEKPGNPPELLFSQLVEIAPGFMRYVSLESDFKSKILILTIASNEAMDPDSSKKYYITTVSQMEGSRVVSGCLASGLHAGDSSVNSHLKNLLYTVEIACATQVKQTALRFSLFDQSVERQILNVVFIDQSIFERPLSTSMADDVKLNLYSGFKDSQAIVQKMSCFNYDFAQLELTQDIQDARDQSSRSQVTHASTTNQNESTTKVSKLDNTKSAVTFQAISTRPALRDIEDLKTRII